MKKIIKLAKPIFSIGICFVLLWIVFNYLIGREIFNMYPIIGYLLTVVVCLKIALLLSILLQAIKKEGLKGVDIQVTRIGNLWIRSFLVLYFFVFGINIGADHYYPLIITQKGLVILTCIGAMWLLQKLKAHGITWLYYLFFMIFTGALMHLVEHTDWNRFMLVVACLGVFIAPTYIIRERWKRRSGYKGWLYLSLTFHTILASIIVINPVDNLSQIFIFLFLVSPLLVSIFVLNEIKKTEKQETPPKLKEKNKSKD